MLNVVPVMRAYPANKFTKSSQKYAVLKPKNQVLWPTFYKGFVVVVV